MKVRTALKGLAPLLIGLALLGSQGCGYHSPYSPVNAGGGRKVSVYMPVWENRTNELGLENQVFQKTADWLRQIGSIALTTEKEAADYRLTGRILRIDHPAAAFSTTSTATMLASRVMVDYRLTARDGREVWQGAETFRGRNYPAGADALRSRSNRAASLEEIAAEIGERIYLRMADTLAAGAAATNNDPEKSSK